MGCRLSFSSSCRHIAMAVSPSSSGMRTSKSTQSNGMPPAQCSPAGDQAPRGPWRRGWLATEALHQSPRQQGVDVVIFRNQHAMARKGLGKQGLGFRRPVLASLIGIPIRELGEKRAPAHRLDEIAIKPRRLRRTKGPALERREQNNTPLAALCVAGGNKRPRILGAECASTIMRSGENPRSRPIASAQEVATRATAPASARCGR